MTFEYPWVLLALIIPLLLGFWEFFRDSQAMIVPFDHAKRRLYPMVVGIMVRILHLGTAVILTAAICILAGPRQLGPPETDRVLTNIILCVDLSGSMGIEFERKNPNAMPNSVTIGGMTTYAFEPNSAIYTRYHAAIDAINMFSSFREGDAFGLTFFGSEYLHWLPVTKDLNALRTCANLLNPNSMPRWFGGTRICNALRGCMARMKMQAEGDRMIIVITDGESQDFANGQDLMVAQELREANIATYFVTINPEVIVTSMATIAGITGGEAMVAGDQQGLQRVFTHIDKMTKSKMKQREADLVDYYAPFALLGLVGVMMSFISILGARVTPW